MRKLKLKEPAYVRPRSSVYYGGSTGTPTESDEPRISGQSELNSDEIKRSYKIYKEAVKLGLVPTQQDLEDRVALANKFVSLQHAHALHYVTLHYIIAYCIIYAKLVAIQTHDGVKNM